MLNVSIHPLFFLVGPIVAVWLWFEVTEWRKSMARKKLAAIPEAIPVPPPLPDRTPLILAAIAGNADRIHLVNDTLTKQLEAIGTLVADVATTLHNRETVDSMRATLAGNNMATLAEKFNGMVEELRRCRVDVLAVQEDLEEFVADTKLAFKLIDERLKEPVRVKISVPEGFKLTPTKK